ncbi:MAG: FHA domain-containing protein [Solirubrobacterales bacterium]
MAGGQRNPVAGQSAAELKLQIEAERDGRPFVVHRSADGELRLVFLAADRMTLGRDTANDVAIEDEQVSRVHAELERISGAWVVSDQGLSTNGTYVNGERIAGRTRLADRDLIEIGVTGILFRQPAPGAAPRATVAADSTETALALTDAQRRVLTALCRPYGSGESFATPATNRAVAEEAHLSVDGVKGHLRVLFDRYGLSELPQNEKRARLAEQALRSGAVKPRDLT